MAIPDFQSVMLPLVKHVSDRKDHSMNEVIEALSLKLKLTDYERKQLLPISQQQIFDNRVRWAATYLKKAGLLESPRRGVIKLSERGQKFLRSNPAELNIKVLQKYPEFVEFQTAKRTAPEEREDTNKFTPREGIESGYRSIRKNLEGELLGAIKACSPNFFERLVIDLLVKMGYGGSMPDAGQAIGRSGDEGIDGIIKEDKLGLDVVYIQAKKWDKTVVGRPEVQKFVGSLHGQRAKKGVYITTSSFSTEARDYAAKIENKVVLIDGQELAQLMMDHGVGVATEATYALKRLDSDYFLED